MIEELSETTGSACPARLLAIHIVHGRVHPEAESKAVVQPRGGLQVKGQDEFGDQGRVHIPAQPNLV